MPFDPAPRTKTSKHQDLIDAIVRGCAVTAPADREECSRYNDKGEYTHACVWMAARIGLGTRAWQPDLWWRLWGDMDLAYRRRYQRSPVDDYERHGFSREEIIERIRAL